MRTIPIDILYPFLKEEEGEILRVYDDQRPKARVTANYKPIGILTAGIGHTGPDVVIGMTVDVAQSRKWLAEDLQDARRKLYSVVKPEIIDELTKHQYAAMLSFTFNLGANKKWSIWKALNSKQFDQIPSKMMDFTKARINGKLTKMDGLVKRRTAEINLWHKNEPGISHAPVTSAEIRETVTPPIPSDPVPPQKSTSIITGAVAVVSTVPVAAAQITSAVEPYSDNSPMVAQIIAIVATIAAIAAIAVLVLTWINKKRARQ